MAEDNQPKDRRSFHYLQPDYERSVFKIPEDLKNEIIQILRFLYKQECSEICYLELERILQVYYAYKSADMLEEDKIIVSSDRFTERDIILITYGDLVKKHPQKPLKTMKNLLQQYLNGVFNTIHILPFFPYSSDRGFAVMDFEEVDPNLGTWEDLLELKSDFKLMFDGVFNHVSSKSHWFQEFLNQNPDYQDFFTVFSTQNSISADHLKLIVRPRTSELLSSFNTLNGPRMVWTTFSTDQIDLNFHNPRVLLKMIEILLTYVRRGADLIRLDAVTYLWEEVGTSCVHLDQTHAIIRLFRKILDAVAPHVSLITETNVSHEENIRYFGNGQDEAQMVYNFALPPLVLHTFQNGNSKELSKWAAGLKKISNFNTYFNFLDSHDGIGVMAVKDILSAAEIESMALKVLEHGGYISYKDNGDGSQSPYEFNITWWSAMNNGNDEESLSLQVDRYLASRAVAMVIMGVPGVYLHGLLGSKNDAELVIEEKQTRSINRKNINKEELIRSLESEESSTHMVTTRMVRMIKKRIHEKLFHPNTPQKIIDVASSVFVVMRYRKKDQKYLISIINVTSESQEINLELKDNGISANIWFDVLGKTNHTAGNGQLTFKMDPFQVMWLKNKN